MINDAAARAEGLRQACRMAIGQATVLEGTEKTIALNTLATVFQEMVDLATERAAEVKP